MTLWETRPQTTSKRDDLASGLARRKCRANDLQKRSQGVARLLPGNFELPNIFLKKGIGRGRKNREDHIDTYHCEIDSIVCSLQGRGVISIEKGCRCEIWSMIDQVLVCSESERGFAKRKFERCENWGLSTRQRQSYVSPTTIVFSSTPA